AATDDRAADSHGQCGNGPARVAAGHDRLGEQTDDRAKADPNQNVVAPLVRRFGDLGVIHKVASSTRISRRPRVHTIGTTCVTVIDICEWELELLASAA